MKHDKHYQDEVLRHLFAEAQVKFDQDPLEQLSQQEIDLLLKPDKILNEVQSIFNQFSVPEDSGPMPITLTPEVPVKVISGYEALKAPIDYLFLRQLDDSQQSYAVVSRAEDKAHLFDMPVLVIEKHGDNTSITSLDNKPVQHKDELVLVREIIEKLKAYYHDAAIGSANSIDISKEMHAVNFNFAIPQSVLFYLYGASKSAQYLPIAIDFDRIGNAFMPAIEGFYKVYGEEPTPQKRSSVKLAGVSLIVNDNEVPIDNSKLGAMWDLFREMTTFDSDTYEIEQFRKRFLSSQTAN